jgi:hypothetical protein
MAKNLAQMSSSFISVITAGALSGHAVFTVVFTTVFTTVFAVVFTNVFTAGTLSVQAVFTWGLTPPGISLLAEADPIPSAT